VKRPRRIILAIVMSAVAAAAVTAAAVSFGGGGAAKPTRTTDLPPATAPVTRTTLTKTQLVNGVLGYGTTVTVNAHGHGTITWLPAPGATIRRGQPVYKADNLAIPLLYGRLPLYRPLQSGDAGDDVEEIEQNLDALGYSGFTVDSSFTSATGAAVRRWQKDLGLTPTGVVDPATVLIAPDALRVVSVAAHLADPANGPVLAYAGITRMVSIDLDVALQNLVKQGLPATITLPDGTTVNGTLATVGTVATAGQDNGGQEQNQPATIEVTVAVDDQARLGTLDQAPVAVSIVAATVHNALTVPVAALVALAEGGYGVQVVTGPTSHYVAVTLGMFAGGRVQITGGDITAGMLVVVPA
jgi:peptidoglycan hydrolase-like protein with peptidoglycan-binding domain